MFSLVLKAYIQLIRFDLCLARRDFAALYTAVRNCPVSSQPQPAARIEGICYAVDLACIWYRKEVLCLQRSAAAVCLLRKHGIPARLVLGTTHIPFKAHAWVEVDGRVVNDKSYTPERYAVLDRC
jgi:hypothetical protein